MKEIGKAVATVAIWAGIIGLAYLFRSHGILNGLGATMLTIGAFCLTLVVWEKDEKKE